MRIKIADIPLLTADTGTDGVFARHACFGDTALFSRTAQARVTERNTG